MLARKLVVIINKLNNSFLQQLNKLPNNKI